MHTIRKSVFVAALSVILAGVFACEQQQAREETQPKPVEGTEPTEATEPMGTPTGQTDPAAAVDSRTKQLLTTIHQSNKAEVEMAQLAKGKQLDPRVQELANTLEQEHKKSNERLEQLAQQMNIDLPAEATEVPQQAQQDMQRLEQAKADQFQHEFVKTQIQMHEKKIEELRTAVKNVENPQVRQYVDETIKHMEEHLKQARQIEQQMATR